MARITLQGNEINTSGNLPNIGDTAPDFSLVNADLEDMQLASYSGKKKLLSIVPSLDTPVCAESTKKFSTHAKKFPNLAILVISADLPFAMSRFCKEQSIDNVETLSTMRGQQFAADYGVLIKDGPLAGLTARAVLVLDENNQVIHAELVSEIADEPDYDQAFGVLS